jgi:hypothetical protein
MFVGAQAFGGSGDGKVTMEARQSLFDVLSLVRRRSAEGFFPLDRSWHGVSNFYSLGRLLRNSGPRNSPNEPDLTRTVAAQDSGSALGPAGLRSRLFENTGSAGKITLSEFRLHVSEISTMPNLSAEVMEHIGADVEKVGPGASYQAWRTSPAYAVWLAETESVGP